MWGSTSGSSVHLWCPSPSWSQWARTRFFEWKTLELGGFALAVAQFFRVPRQFFSCAPCHVTCDRGRTGFRDSIRRDDAPLGAKTTGPQVQVGWCSPSSSIDMDGLDGSFSGLRKGHSDHHYFDHPHMKRGFFFDIQAFPKVCPEIDQHCPSIKVTAQKPPKTLWFDDASQSAGRPNPCITMYIASPLY